MGRPKGSKNKNKTRVQELAEKLGVEPFQILLHFATGDWKALGYTTGTSTRYSTSGEPYEVDLISPKDRLFAASEACNYMYPKRKAVDLSHELDVSGQVDVQVSKKEFIKQLAGEPKALQALEILSTSLNDAGTRTRQ